MNKSILCAFKNMGQFSRPCRIYIQKITQPSGTGISVIRQFLRLNARITKFADPLPIKPRTVAKLRVAPRIARTLLSATWISPRLLIKVPSKSNMITFPNVRHPTKCKIATGINFVPLHFLFIGLDYDCMFNDHISVSDAVLIV